ncbi:hypothetical protein E05_49190 [Plautia stali symbiont]|nr:hypothetical protein E05_49190 [Plautia stali symbiont]
MVARRIELKRAHQLHVRQQRDQRITAGLTQQQIVITPVWQQVVVPLHLSLHAALRQQPRQH